MRQDTALGYHLHQPASAPATFAPPATRTSPITALGAAAPAWGAAAPAWNRIYVPSMSFGRGTVGLRRPSRAALRVRGLGGRRPDRDQRGLATPGESGASFARPYGRRNRVRNRGKATISQV